MKVTCSIGNRIRARDQYLCHDKISVLLPLKTFSNGGSFLRNFELRKDKHVNLFSSIACVWLSELLKPWKPVLCMISAIMSFQTQSSFAITCTIQWLQWGTLWKNFMINSNKIINTENGLLIYLLLVYRLILLLEIVDTIYVMYNIKTFHA